MVWVWVFGGEGAARDSGERESKHTVCTYFLPAAAAVYNVISHISHHPTHMLGFQLHAVSQNGASLFPRLEGWSGTCFALFSSFWPLDVSSRVRTDVVCVSPASSSRQSLLYRPDGVYHPHGSFVRSFVGWKDAAEIAG
jgi:hypothetical protein